MALAKLGSFTTCAAADLGSATHAVNALTPGRVGDGGIGKHTGQVILVAGASDIKTAYVALGPNPTDKWAPLNGSTVVTPS